METVTSDITKAVGEENSKKIHDTFSKFDQSGGANVTANLWKLKKETFPKVSPSLPAVKQDINGRLISGQKKLQKLYSDVFTHRLRHRPTINEDYKELHDLQSELLQKRMMASKHVQTPDWTEDDVVKVLRSLKRGKAKDPHYMINELFMPPVAGPDLVKSVTKMMNIIKQDRNIPEQFRYKNISAVWKRKGSQTELNNFRGIFTCSILSNILQKLIYNDSYETIEEHLSDANIGSRKNKNVRNHSFIVNGVILETLRSKNKSTDIEILDLSRRLIP